MPSKQGSGRNKIDLRALCIYALLCTLCMVLSYLENLLPTEIIAPGIKLGLANSVALLLVCSGDTRGAFLVNTARIFLSALLFGSPVSFVFSLAAGLCSLAVTALLYRIKLFGTVGLSVCGAVAHNLAQTVVAFVLLGAGVWLYFPLLLLVGTASGAAVGFLCGIILKKIKTNR